jgi:hypothetical protein
VSYPNRGGRIAPDNRPAQAKGVGKNSKRHDLERRSTPFLHDSDLQQGDVQALENGQRIAPKQTQRPAGPAPTASRSTTGSAAGTGPADIPDAIDFISSLPAAAGGLTPPPAGITPSANLDMWVRYAQYLANGPGASGLLRGAFINQMRQLKVTPQNTQSVIINLNDIDAGLEVALDEEQANRAGPRS